MLRRPDQDNRRPAEAAAADTTQSTAALKIPFRGATAAAVAARRSRRPQQLQHMQPQPPSAPQPAATPRRASRGAASTTKRVRFELHSSDNNTSTELGAIDRLTTEAAAHRAGGNHDAEMHALRQAIEKYEAAHGRYAFVGADGWRREQQYQQNLFWLHIMLGRAARSAHQLPQARQTAGRAFLLAEQLAATADGPSLQAESLRQMALTYRLCGHADHALTCSERALALFRTAPPASPAAANTFRLACILAASLCCDSRRMVQAYATAMLGLDIAETFFGPVHLNTAASLSSVARTFMVGRRYRRAVAHFNRAICIREELSLTMALACDLCDCATCLMHLGNLGQALEYADQAMEVGVRLLGRGHRQLQRPAAVRAEILLCMATATATAEQSHAENFAAPPTAISQETPIDRSTYGFHAARKTHNPTITHNPIYDTISAEVAEEPTTVETTAETAVETATAEPTPAPAKPRPGPIYATMKPNVRIPQPSINPSTNSSSPRAAARTPASAPAVMLAPPPPAFPACGPSPSSSTPPISASCSHERLHSSTASFGSFATLATFAETNAANASQQSAAGGPTSADSPIYYSLSPPAPHCRLKDLWETIQRERPASIYEECDQGFDSFLKSPPAKDATPTTTEQLDAEAEAEAEDDSAAQTSGQSAVDSLGEAAEEMGAKVATRPRQRQPLARIDNVVGGVAASKKRVKSKAQSAPGPLPQAPPLTLSESLAAVCDGDSLKEDATSCRKPASVLDTDSASSFAVGTALV